MRGTSEAALKGLYEVAERKLAVAEIPGLSNAGRFQYAYEAIVLLTYYTRRARGGATPSTQEGRLDTECLRHLLALDAAKIRILEALDRKRDRIGNEDHGEITNAELREVLEQAGEVKRLVDLSLHPRRDR